MACGKIGASMLQQQMGRPDQHAHVGSRRPGKNRPDHRDRQGTDESEEQRHARTARDPHSNARQPVAARRPGTPDPVGPTARHRHHGGKGEEDRKP